MLTKSIIIIENNKEHAGLIVSAFKGCKESFDIKVFYSSKHLINKLKNGNNDVIICSTHFSEEISNDILSNNSFQNIIPVIFLSDKKNTRLKNRLLKNGAYNFFEKSPELFAFLPEFALIALREFESRAARRTAEFQLLQIQNKYQMVTENINDVIWELSLDLKNYLFVSDSISWFLGYEPGEFLIQNFIDIIHEESMEEINILKISVARQLKQGKDPRSVLIDLDVKFIHKDGSLRWGKVRGFLVSNEKNEVLAICGITQNITRQKIAEKQLKIQETFFQSLIEQAPLAIAILDTDDRIQQVNDQFLKMFGYTKRECLNARLNELIVPDDLHEEGEYLSRVVAEGEYMSTETMRKDKSGNLIDVQIQGKMVTLNESQLGVFGIYQDISKRKHYEKRLQQLSERLLLATSSASIGIWDYDLMTRKLVWESEMFTLHNIGKQAIINPMQEWEAVVLEEDKEKLNFIFNRELPESENFQTVYRIMHPDEKIKHIRLFASIYFDEHDKPSRLVGCCWDITNEVENAELNKKIEISARVADIKQQFLANMSHEIRSPMTGILGMIDLLMRTHLNDQQKFYVETIRKSSDGLHQIVNDILDLSKIEAGKMMIKPAHFNLRDSGNTLYSLYHAIAEQKGLDFVFYFDDDLPEKVFADENRIGQIISNLLSNAIKFTSSGYVKLFYDMFDEDKNSITLKISVSDTGIGIRNSDRKNLFSMFSQLDNSDTRNYEGTGLGLSISDRLAQLMNATIDVESEPGKGSVFSLIVKCPKKSIKEKPVSVKEKLNLTNGEEFNFNVLLVEDKVTNQMVISLMFSEIGCNVDLASNGKDALEKVNPGKHDFVFMDIQMPVMDGMKASEEIRRMHEDAELPLIIGLSAKAMEGDAEYYISRGMDDYLTKPVTTEILQNCLKKWSPMVRKKKTVKE
ncbi:MAG: PAS domain S-box protein [Bacteroidales bacterium]